MAKYMLVDKETGEVVEPDVVLVGAKPFKVDRGFVKVFIAFLRDVVEDKELMAGPVRLLLYMLERMNMETLQIVIKQEEACRDLQAGARTYYRWVGVLQRKGIIKRLGANLYELKPYVAVKGKMSKALERTRHGKFSFDIDF